MTNDHLRIHSRYFVVLQHRPVLTGYSSVQRRPEKKLLSWNIRWCLWCSWFGARIEIRYKGQWFCKLNQISFMRLQNYVSLCWQVFVRTQTAEELSKSLQNFMSPGGLLARNLDAKNDQGTAATAGVVFSHTMVIFFTLNYFNFLFECLSHRDRSGCFGHIASVE